MIDLLVSTEWLAEHLYDPGIRVVDIRGHVLPASQPPPHYFNHYGDYQNSHIPNALFVDWVNEITDPDDPRHAKIAQMERYGQVMSRLGISPDTLVVAYDDAAGMFAARLWWSLNYYGHERVVVLDGGWNKWSAENRPINAELPTITPTNFTAITDPVWIRTIEYVENNLSTEARLIDVRTPQEFSGLASRAQRSGHIPGAFNLPRGEMITSDGTILSPNELRERFVQVGIDDATPEVVMYCNGGISASFGLLALHYAGFQNGAVYDGSWKEWGNDDSRPIEM